MTKRTCSGKTKPRQSIFLPLLVLLFLSIPLFSHAADTFTVYVKDTDRYGRIVGEVILPDGLRLNKELVYVGLAWWSRKYAPNDRTLKAFEVGAREAKRGLWADQNPISPWEWRTIERYHLTNK